MEPVAKRTPNVFRVIVLTDRNARRETVLDAPTSIAIMTIIALQVFAVATRGRLVASAKTGNPGPMENLAIVRDICASGFAVHGVIWAQHAMPTHNAGPGIAQMGDFVRQRIIPAEAAPIATTIITAFPVNVPARVGERAGGFAQTLKPATLRK